LGGSLGAVRVNEFIISCLKELLEKYQVLHQVGLLNIEDATDSSQLILKEISSSLQSRYKLEGFLNIEKQKLAFAAADVVISRAGAGGIFETATFGKPAILIPLNGSANDHQKVNAYEYAKCGAGVVLEEENMTVHLLLMELKDILEKPEIYARMSTAAKNFAKPHAAETLAREILNLGGSAS
jgi:UDP-N-acetylglucosamine--N-acetylmuramyl-(pentapeptide) pyrophosphoryl-undecaprenol N-acetylglucosamine transferase